MINNNSPIGIFDSGVGGLTVANAITKHLPNESVIYFGDTAHLPYGEKSEDAIRYYALRIAKFLIRRNCKMIVVACNSAAAAAHDVLHNFFGDQILLVNVIDPLIEETKKESFNKIGVIATKVTVTSNIYKQKLKNNNPNLEVESLATPLLVPMIEEGFFQNKISQTIISEYLSNPKFENIDALLLACTHYPLIKKDIEHFFKNKIKVMDSNLPVAREVERQLIAAKLLSENASKGHQFFISDYTNSFKATAKFFYKEKIELEPIKIWK